MADKTVLEAIIDSNVGEVSKGLEQAADNTQKLEDSTKKASGGFGGLGRAITGVGSAIKKAGFGLLITIFAAFANALRENQKVIDFFNTTLKATSIVFNDLFKFLDKNFAVIQGYLKGLFTDPIGELYKLGQAIQIYFVDNLGGVVDLIKSVQELLANVTNPRRFLESIGKVSAATTAATKDLSTVFDELTTGVKEYTSGVIENASALVELDKKSQIAIATNQKILEQKDREAEIERQIRDDVTNTFEDRIAANERLNDVLDEQEKLMLANNAIVLKAVEAQANLTEKVEDEVAVIQVKAEKAGILAQIEGFRSEQKINGIALTEEEKAVNQENAEAQLAAYGQLAGALSSLAGDNKELAVAGALIDTYAGANKAFAQGGVVGFVTGAAIIAQGLSNVQKIMSTKVPGGGSGGGGGGRGPAPQMMSGQFELTGGETPEPTRAYVVTDEMTNSQDQLANIRRRSTI